MREKGNGEGKDWKSAIGKREGRLLTFLRNPNLFSCCLHMMDWHQGSVKMDMTRIEHHLVCRQFQFLPPTTLNVYFCNFYINIKLTKLCAWLPAFTFKKITTEICNCLIVLYFSKNKKTKLVLYALLYYIIHVPLVLKAICLAIATAGSRNCCWSPFLLPANPHSLQHVKVAIALIAKTPSYGINFCLNFNY